MVTVLDRPHDTEREVRLERLMQEERDRQEVRIRLADEQLPPMPIIETLAEMLADDGDDDRPPYIVEDLLLRDGTALLVAEATAGKTTLLVELVRAALDGEPFLGRFNVAPCRRVVWLDCELDRPTLKGEGFFGGMPIRNRDRLEIAHLSGHAGFDPRGELGRARWVERLLGADLVIIDGLGAALTALEIKEDDNYAVSRFLDHGLTPLRREADIGGMIAVHHTGHQGERPRGASRFRGWPDSKWSYTGKGKARTLTVNNRDGRPTTKITVELDQGRRRLTVAEPKPPAIDLAVARKLMGTHAERLRAELEAAYVRHYGGTDGAAAGKVNRAVEDGHLVLVRMAGRAGVYGAGVR